MFLLLKRDMVSLKNSFFSSTVIEWNKTLLNIVSCIVPNIFYFNNDQLTEILFHGKENLDNINNRSILDAIMNYLNETKRSDAQLF